MGNRYPISTEYFCSNCEDEVTGLPVGARCGSRRPLCLRCTQIGIEEGWADSQEPEPEKRIYSPRRTMGGFLILALLFFSGLALFAAMAVFGPHGRR